jgi:hypothetical protein
VGRRRRQRTQEEEEEEEEQWVPEDEGEEWLLALRQRTDRWRIFCEDGNN